MKLSTALGVMRVIATSEMHGALGVTPAEMALISGPSPWMAGDRVAVRRVLDSLIYGTMDTMGLPHFELSAEYVAAHIVGYVHPVNMLAACVWLSRVVDADQLVAEKKGTDNISARRLHAFCVKLLDAEVDEYRQMFEKVVGHKVRKAERSPVPAE